MLNSIGERIAFCRGLLGFTRKEFVNQFKIVTLSTFARWELNTINIPEQKIKKLIEFFNNSGILVKSEWIRYNEGIPPINITLKNFEANNFDEIVYLALNSVSQKIKDFKFFQINNNFFDPILKYGDYVGGITIKNNYEALNNKLCFIKTENEVAAGIFDIISSKLKNISNNFREYNLNNVVFGEVTWIIRRPSI